MSMKSLILAAVVVTATAFTGCKSTHEGAYPPKNTMKNDLENQASFVLLDKQVQNSVTCSGIQQQTQADGRLKVTANIRNRENRRIQVQVNCVFKDENGFPTGDETPFQNLILTENAQEGVMFLSMNDKARKYTIRVREAH